VYVFTLFDARNAFITTSKDLESYMEGFAERSKILAGYRWEK